MLEERPRLGARRDPDQVRQPRTKRRLRAFISTLACCIAAAEAMAWAPEAPGGTSPLTARLLIHPDDGPREIRVGLWLAPDPGWHIYWRNPGPIGLPTRLQWHVEGGEPGPVRWPAPSAFDDGAGQLAGYGYSEEVLLATTVDLTRTEGAVNAVQVDAEVLLCSDECVPVSITLSSDLPAEAAASDAARTREIFRTQSARVPASPAELYLETDVFYSRDAIRAGDSFQAVLRLRSCAAPDARGCLPWVPDGELAFFPESNEGLELSQTSWRGDPSDERLSYLELSGRAEGDSSADARMRAVVRLRSPAGEIRAVRIDLPLPGDAPEPSSASTAPPPFESGSPRPPRVGLLTALLLGLAGGLLLNLMPCVLPVLGIKALALAELAGANRAKSLAHAGAHAAGVLATLSALALATVGLRAAGHAVGWGFQLQNPIFVTILSAVLVVAALNFFGVFEVGSAGRRLAGIGAHSSGAARSFFDGLLVVLLATPCSAPYLGSALGVAFASPAASVFAIFLAIGTGLSAPLLLIAATPGSRRWIPRPGPWMDTLRVALGFGLLGGAVWLLWIARSAVGADGVVATVALLVAIAFAAWLAHTARGWPAPARAAISTLLLVGLTATGYSVMRSADGGTTAETSEWRRFEQAGVRNELAQGRPVFVFFTADWCLTCKVNEVRVIDNGRVRSELQELDVAVFRADWTQRDESLRRELARHGRAGVPLYLVYSPRNPSRPELLSELLGVEELVDALRRAT